ncbi:hypothetical protein CYLTODRAFT_360293 [Cylindrobasidium torrendii FP15055 ss-10]|uniref:Uncharacterized protein n=1 Tax=Cylindrobasidium torrendii FP15055 ss-10 TaxID=1314674 RepID=A0A0D7AYF1_9AGAR|nr:hypothetical protein CYLTODRAFT_360293 [Cylindrobasidium torrendii FP15055 ss-10]
MSCLALDPKVIASGFAQDGNSGADAVDGQASSLTSTNNFINFCLTVPNLPITNGQQIESGSCNPAPIGAIPAKANMPSAKFANPANGATIAADKAFTVQMNIKNMETGTFVNAAKNYFAAPQQLNGQGQIIGHSHVVIEELQSQDQTTPTNPANFAFFKGINTAAKNGVLTADVTDGLPAGEYRMCSINSSSNHQPLIVPVAQHGSLDDCVYFTATNGGGNAGGNGGNAGNNGQNAGQNGQNGGQNAGNAGQNGQNAGGQAGQGGQGQGGGRGGGRGGVRLSSSLSI